MQTVTIEEAIETISPNSVVYSSGNGLTPVSFLEALAVNPDIDNISLYGALFTGPRKEDPKNLFSPEVTERIKHKVFFAGPHARKAINEGRAQFVPKHLSRLPEKITEWGIDTLILKVSEPVNGNYSFGLATGALLEVINGVSENGKIIVVPSSHVPYFDGATIQKDRIDFLVNTVEPEPIPTMNFNSNSQEVLDIAQMLLELYIRQGQTLQLGIGIPAAVAGLIKDERIGDIYIFTEVMAQTHYDLIEAGLVTNAGLDYSFIKDEELRGKAEKDRVSVAAFFFSDSVEGYKTFHNNPNLLAQSVSVTNNSRNIQSQPNMVSINGAAMIDLYGNVCVTHIMVDGKPSFMAGIGGHRDYCVNADKGIIAMTSRARGNIPRILPFTPGSLPPSITLFDERIYATEQGIVDISQVNTLEEAAVAISYLAHPEDRKPLYEALLEMPGVSKSYVHACFKDGAVPKGFTPREQILGR